MSENILAIDSCSDISSLAINQEQMVWAGNQNQSMELLPRIEKLMIEAGLSFSDLDGIVVINGPGSYTGVRIAVSVANAMGLALGVEIRAVDSLKCQAWILREKLMADRKAIGQDDNIFSLLGAGGDRVYARKYRFDLGSVGDFVVGEIAYVIDDESENINIVGEVNEVVENWLKSSGYKNFELLNNSDRESRAVAAVSLYDELKPTKNNIAIPIYLRGPVR